MKTTPHARVVLWRNSRRWPVHVLAACAFLVPACSGRDTSTSKKALEGRWRFRGRAANADVYFGPLNTCAFPQPKGETAGAATHLPGSYGVKDGDPGTGEVKVSIWYPIDPWQDGFVTMVGTFSDGCRLFSGYSTMRVESRDVLDPVISESAEAEGRFVLEYIDGRHEP